MRQILTLAILLIGFFSCQAQIRGNILYNQAVFLPGIFSDYDSLVYVIDTTTPISNYSSGTIERFVDGRIKTLSVYDNNQNQFEESKATTINGQTTMVTFNYPVNLQDTIFKTVSIVDVNGFDSVMTYYEKHINAFGAYQRLLLDYDSNGKINSLIFQDKQSQFGFSNVFEFDFYYSIGRLDSIYRTDLKPPSIVGGKLFYNYDNQGNLDTIKVFETINGALILSSLFLLKNNANTEITEVVTVHYNSTTQQFEFFDQYKFFKRPKFVGISSQLSFTKTTMFPNPVVDVIQISTENTFSQYWITNVHGELIMKGEFSSSLHVKSLAKGIYFLHLNRGSQREILKFLKS